MKKIISGLTFLILFICTSCNDGFLDKSPVTGLTEENAFTSYDNFKSFMWPCYEMFTNNTLATAITAVGQDGFYRGDIWAGYMEKKQESGYNTYAYQTVASVATGNGWDFKTYIRRINIMLSRIDSSRMTDSEKNHWRAVGYFFHSFWYMELINRFGDVPWVDKPLNESSAEIYGPRESRDVVAAKVLERLKWAEENIGDFESRDGSNTINVHCVRAALSRFTLREGTWRKYHELSNADTYLNECTRVSKVLMNDFPTLFKGAGVDANQPAAGYGQMWNTDDLADVPGVILYKEYTSAYAGNQCYIEHTSSHHVEMNQNTVDLYLMKNGKPIMNEESNYHGSQDIYAVFRDRDPRLYQVVIPPYKVVANGANKPAGNPNATWGYTDNPAHREYIDLLGANESCSNPGVGMKRLPGQNWSASLVPEIPRLGTGAFVTCRSGYYVWKNWNNWETNFNNGARNTADKPIFKIEEVLLNYAEAMFETSKFTQSVADETINKLRERVDIEGMTVADINADFDPNRGYYYPQGNTNGVQVDPILWEIRRERIIELMGEGFGFDDIRRWRMAPWFLNKTATGFWANKEYATAQNMTLYNPETGFSDGKNGNMTEGYLFLFNNPVKEGKGWLDKYYLYQVPTTELILNPELEQNPGW
ncbi:RagB/SusD family nutrient uptake outer membrane protein [Bacteroides sp. 519]|uniref:RagB/SusD family nutrient uptake outer membrane protein n=1 Tax=Bacteroides sp. 519 TaxID=2302937 RepID=UPI00351A8A22